MAKYYFEPKTGIDFGEVFYGHKRNQAPVALKLGTERDAGRLLRRLVKLIPPNFQVNINPFVLAERLDMDLIHLYENLFWLYMHHEITHFFGADRYIPQFDDELWRIKTFQHYYNYVKKPKTKPRYSQQHVRERTIKERGHQCEWCGYPGYIELHHIIEVQHGGTHDEENLLLLCEKCHADAHGWNKYKYLDKNRKFWQGGSN